MAIRSSGSLVKGNYATFSVPLTRQVFCRFTLIVQYECSMDIYVLKGAVSATLLLLFCLFVVFLYLGTRLTKLLKISTQKYQEE